MSVRKQFEKHFSEKNLKRIFTEHVIYSGATGIDNLNQYSFRKQLDEQIQILSRKMLAGSYGFTKYRLKLVSKGRGKIPREIAIPTVRDRIAMRAMCDFLSERFESSLNLELPQNVIASVKNDAYSKKYTGCIKLDVSNFYPSVVHAELESRLKKRIRDESILDVIQSAISSPTVSISKSSDKRAERGVPQGLAISNVLAAIYLINIDRYMNAYPNISYYRYVDDILIFCKYKDAEYIAGEVISRFNKIGLEVHDPIEVPEKSSIGRISKRFDYLGYQFEGNLVTARQATIEKLRTSLVAIFTSYKHSDKKNEHFLVWRLNLRITGCIFENKSKGWLFFFSEINDETLLHSLDHYVKKLIKRFDLKIKPKKFSRAFKELSHRKYETNYIPNFDKYTLDKQRDVLTHYFNMNISKYTDEEVTFAFHKRIGKQVKDLQEDIKDFKY
ncbi:RNA-dependent DNA polymerase [Shewanella algae]|uniref:Reverse transcriptase n=1 Tax=Shewanella algae TaxID=38313 RepID=A0AAD1NLU1_9GAMM|nr:reverse transcriptase domain-containing protein [Shewanella algae]MBO2594582.1 RNA-dependent DNA polymerase [Shewanella algae]MBO2665938.1 RNA-dependent DNA polymerase [Shewanella algae]BCV44358.1 reverse transcriptase [Shewanella algae]